ncbi:MAG: glycerate kinase [Ruminococcaceae bacterium]|nr:glycerate kinase [Oscillospiraceae bacterium]
MRVVVAIDSFKGSLSSSQAGNAVKDAIIRLNKNSDVFVSSLADGGEGTVAALSSVLDSREVEVSVNGPLLRTVNAKYCILKNTNTAVIEMASAAGITLVSENERNPMNTTTYGVGELIKDAINKGCRRFIVGIGGSATNDGGTGMLRALGYEFLDENNNPIELGAKGLACLSKIDTSKVMSELKECTFNIACDVTNPLCGENGCSAVFAPQKGATPEMIADMDRWLKNYAMLANKITDKADAEHAGAGAAGGLGFAFLAFTNAKLKSGVDIVLEESGIEKYIESADIVVTGEGRLDSQTVMGKAPIGVAKLAKKHGKRVIAFSGCVTDDAEICNDYGVDAFFSILRGVVSLEEALDPANAYDNLTATAYQVFRLLELNDK